MQPSLKLLRYTCFLFQSPLPLLPTQGKIIPVNYFKNIQCVDT